MKNVNISLSFILLALITANAVSAEETEIRRKSERYANREIIDRILDKKAKGINAKLTDNIPELITKTLDPSEGLDTLSRLGVNDIFTETEDASSSLSLKQVVEMALQNNIALNIEKINPEIYETSVQSEKAAFDTNLSATLSASDKRTKSINASDDITEGSNNGTTFSVEAENKSTSGITTNVNASVNRTRTTSHSSLYATRLGIDVTAPLMRGAGKAVNLVSLKKAELDLDWSKYEFYGYLLDFVSETERKYWQYYLNVKELEIVKESYQLALQQREETMKRIEVGKIAESELAAADAEVALCQEDLINAESTVVSSAVSLLRCMNHDSDNFWRKRPNLTSVPKLREIDQYDFNLEDCIEDALMLRPELRQAELLQRKNELEIVASRNGMLPRLDLFLSLGKTGYSKSFEGSEPSFNHKKPFDASVGLTYSLNPQKRAERAKLNKANLNKKMQAESIKNLEQIIKEEVIKAYIEIKRTKEQMVATAATEQKQEEKLRVENVKFNVGKTTAFQVSQAQRDLQASKIAQIKAIIDYTVAKSELLRSTGLLLKFRGIEVE